MRYATIATDRGPRAAALRDGGFVDLQANDRGLPASLRELFAAGDEVLKRAAAVAATGSVQPCDEKRLMAPIADPPKVICVGLNYADHAKESGAEVGPEPIIFNKFPSAVCGPHDPIRLPPISQQVDYEAELVVVIGRGGSEIPKADARSHVAGYMCGHDVSARDWQLHKPGGQWLLGKTFDTFAPCGPALVTPDEVPDPEKLRITFRLNGETLQDSTTAQLIFGIDHLISYISAVATLESGDLIFTGTPPGVGAARKPPVFLKPGDTAEVEIEGLGVLTNPVESRG